MSNALGMYEAGQEPSVEIGEFRLIRQSASKIWVAHESGEGGEFDEEALAAVIRKFYSENF